MLLFEEKKGYIISIGLFLIAFIVFVIGLVSIDFDSDTVSLSYDTTLEIESYGFAEYDLLIRSEDGGDIDVEVVERNSFVNDSRQQIYVTFEDGERFRINISPLDQDMEYDLYYVWEHTYSNLDKNERVNIGSILLYGQGVFEFTITHLGGNHSEGDILYISEDSLFTANVGHRSAFFITLSALFGIIGLYFFYIVYSKRNKINQKVRELRLAQMGVPPLQQLRNEAKENARLLRLERLTSKRRFKKAPKRPHGRNYIISALLLTSSIVLIVLTIISLVQIAQSSEQILPIHGFYRFIAFCLFFASVFLFLNTMTGRKAYRKHLQEQQRQEELALLQEEQEQEQDPFEEDKEGV